MSDSALSGGLDRLFAPLEISQHRRMLQIETSFLSTTLLVARAHWTEATSGHWPTSQPPASKLTSLRAEIDCLSTSTHLKLTELIGEQVSLRLMRADGTYRPVHGYVAGVALLGTDGGLSQYRLELVDFTHFMSMRRDTRVLHQRKADEIIQHVLSAYPQANFRFELSAKARSTAPKRGTTTQWRESDADFVARLLSQEGWNWRLEHADDGAPVSSAKAAKHCLVISDPQAQRPDLGALRYGRTDVRQRGVAEDTITQMSFERSVQPNAVTLGAWHPGQLAGVSTHSQTALDIGALPFMEVYRGEGERTYADHDPGLNHGDDVPLTQVAEHRAGVALQRHELAIKTSHVRSAVRTAASGCEFGLTEHSRFSAAGQALSGAEGGRTDNRFLILSVTHRAANNLGAQAAEVLKIPEIEAGTYRNECIAVPAAATLVPIAIAKPRFSGFQTAIVVGHPTDVVTTDRDLRVRVQFPWQRGARPLHGGLAGPQTPALEDTGHATSDLRASMWVRTGWPSAGANSGHVTMPRNGDEVLVAYVNGDIDRPMLVGQLHNGADAQPWPAGVGSGMNHPGTLSGYHAPTHDGLGLSQWVIDDATGQLRMRLASYSAASGWSELSLGHIIGQGMHGGGGGSQRGAWLGSGFYAHTDGWAFIRADGLYVSTMARPATYGSAQSTTMDTTEARGLLVAAQNLGQRLNEIAGAQGAVTLQSHDAVDGQALRAVLKAIDPKQDGKYPGTMGGQDTRKGNGRKLETAAESFARPHIVFDTPQAAAFVSPASIAAYSGVDTSITAQDDLHLTAQATAAFASGETTSIYNHENELKAYAASGNVSLRAHTDKLELHAERDVVITSVNDEITIAGQDFVEIVGGDSKLVLRGGDIEYHTRQWVVQAAGHDWAGPGTAPASPSVLPVGGTVLEPQTLRLDHRYHDNEGIAGAQYEVTFANGEKRTGTLDGQGRAVLDGVPSGAATVKFGPSLLPYKGKGAVANPTFKGKPSSGDLDRLIEKYAAGLEESGASGSKT